MRAVLITAALVAAAPAWNLATAEAREADCNPYYEYSDLLLDQGEMPMMAGLEPDTGLRVELWVNHGNGAFSILLVEPKARTACFLSFGEGAMVIDPDDLEVKQ